MFGVTHTRPIYERAVEVLKDDEARCAFHSFHVNTITVLVRLYRAGIFHAGFIRALMKCRCRDMCMRFADMERKLGEIDRARAVYTYASQFSDPRVRSENSILLVLFHLY